MTRVCVFYFERVCVISFLLFGHVERSAGIRANSYTVSLVGRDSVVRSLSHGFPGGGQTRCKITNHRRVKRCECH